MKTIRVLLADDERAGRSRLRRMLEAEADLEIVSECGDGNAAVEAIRSERPDLCFLDIQMPGLDGFAVLDALGPNEQPGAVIFVTAYDEHAVRAFEACALDYLLKPASPERVARAVARARTHLSHLAEAESASASDEQKQKRFAVRSGQRLSFVSPEEVDWVEAAGNYMILHVGPQNHMIRETMRGMEGQLPKELFLRVSRSAIVNLRRIKELSAAPQGDAAILLDGQRIHVTRPLREVSERLAAI